MELVFVRVSNTVSSLYESSECKKITIVSPKMSDNFRKAAEIVDAYRDIGWKFDTSVSSGTTSTADFAKKEDDDIKAAWEALKNVDLLLTLNLVCIKPAEFKRTN
jgi:hypothetical protein